MTLYRWLEFIPGVLTWLTLGGAVLLSIKTPVVVAVFIILFDVYWLLRVIYLFFHLQATFNKMKKYLKINWLAELKKLTPSPDVPDWTSIYHLVIFPMYREPYEVVKESFLSLSQANYPLDKFIVVLATEERGGAKDEQVAQKIAREFGNKFFKFLVTKHPDNLPGELAGKGSNETWAGKEVKRLVIDPLKLPYENILVSVFDADTQIFPEYFGRLTYTFLTESNRQRASFQPITLFTNNVYETPSLAMIIAFASTFWNMMNQSRPEVAITFSSHSMPFKALVEIGFWAVDHVSEDSMIFWQCYLHYHGDWRVVPLFYPVSMDANATPYLWTTLINLYKQQRRWAWGAENIPYMLFGFIHDRFIPLRKKIYWSFHLIESFHSWSTNAFLIFALGWLPIFLGGEAFNLTVLSFNLPKVTSTILTFSSVGIAASAILSVLLLPPRPSWFRKYHYLFYFVQWFLTPVTLVIFGALPAIEAQTRLLLGGRFRLGFWATPKSRRTVAG